MQNLEQELQQKTAQLAALREISRAINAAWDLKDTLELITRKTAQVMGMDSCSIYLLDEAREYLVLKATTGLAGWAAKWAGSVRWAGNPHPSTTGAAMASSTASARYTRSRARPVISRRIPAACRAST